MRNVNWSMVAVAALVLGVAMYFVMQSDFMKKQAALVEAEEVATSMDVEGYLGEEGEFMEEEDDGGYFEEGEVEPESTSTTASSAPY